MQEKRSWSLENAAEIQKGAPYTFYRPSDDIIDRLKPGEATVKLIFSFESDESDAPGAERMWVIIDSIEKDGTYVGTLDNDPSHIKDLKAGDKIKFGREHIIQFDTLDDMDVDYKQSLNIERFFKKCIVSNQVLIDKDVVSYIYREEPSDDEDTGWHIMSNNETQEYLDDSSNLQYIAIGKVLNMDDSFLNLLDSPVGSEFARDNITNTFFSLND